MATGREIKQVYNAMKRICWEASQMLTVIHDNFGKRGFVINSGSKSVMWDTSSSYDNPNRWLPYFQQIVFKCKADTDANKCVGVNTMFDAIDGDLEDAVPFISCGMITCRDRDSFKNSNEFYLAGWDGRAGITTKLPLYTTTFSSENCKEIVNYFLPLDAITSEEKVVSLIVDPLISLYKGEHNEAIERVRDFAISVDQLRASAS